MQKLIIMLFAILLGVYIGTTLFLGPGGTSLKSTATTVVQSATSQLNDAVD